MPVSDILISPDCACPVISKVPQETAPDRPVLHGAAGMRQGCSGCAISAGVRASSSMSVDHAPWSPEMPSGRGWKPGSRRGQPRCPRRPSAGPAPLRWDMNYPPTN